MRVSAPETEAGCRLTRRSGRLRAASAGSQDRVPDRLLGNGGHRSSPFRRRGCQELREVRLGKSVARGVAKRVPGVTRQMRSQKGREGTTLEL